MELHETVAVPEFVILVGDIPTQVKPVGTVSVSVTVPVNPFTALMVIVDVALWPESVAAGNVAVIVKPLTWKTMFAVVWDSEPLVPVTVTV